MDWHGDDIDPQDISLENEEAVVAGGEDPELVEGREAEAKIAKMREELNACRKEKQEYMDGWQRAKADYVNLLRRTDEAAKAAESSGKIKAVETLLPAFDALERAKEHLNLEVGLPSDEGFLAIAKQLESAFASLGLKEIGKVGEKFDPALHDALAQDKAESLETDDTVTAVLEKGWRVADVVIRPAKVKVAHFENNKPNEDRAPGR